MTLEKPLSLRDFLNSSSRRLGLKQLAGGIGLPKPTRRIHIIRLEKPTELSLLSLPGAICIFPLRIFSFCQDAQYFPPSSACSSSMAFPSRAACIALPGVKEIPEVLIRNAMDQETLLVASIYGEYLLESRLIGLLREECEGRTTLSGGLINIAGMGVLITGESGLGKTTCALELVKRGHRWVADDVVILQKKSEGMIYGRNWDMESPLLEIKGRGIVRAEEIMKPSAVMTETKIDCFIELVDGSRWKSRNAPGNDVKSLTVLGTEIPGVSLPVSQGASGMATRVEFCARTLRQLREKQ